MLRKIRRTLAVLSIALLTLLFLDFTGTLHVWFGWLADIQFVPAVLALNAAVIVGLLVLTLLFGRVYCSVICPLGIFQDIISYVSGLRRRKRHRFSYSPAINWLRYIFLALFIVALAAGFASFASLLDPYAAYGRMASHLLAPVYRWGNNLLAGMAEKLDSYAFYNTEIWLKSLPVLIVAIATLVVLCVLAWRNGRTYCNTVCPVGTVLGFISRYSLFRPVIDTEKCTHCHLCSRTCKASCIDSENTQIDYSRCVACMDCLDTCRQKAITYRSRFRMGKAHATETTSAAQPDKERRRFLSTTVLLATSAVLKAQEKKVDGGLAVIEDKKIPARATRLTPPGSLDTQHFAQHCTACQLCVSACPNQVLRPSSDLRTFMQPEMSYERGYCRPECTECSKVCPAGAILPITPAEKSAIQIGHAVWIANNCVVLTDGVACGNCARHCPTGAISMLPYVAEDASSPKIPVVNTERCIGCGACENLCPARPFSAIYVEGHEVHRTI